MHKHHFFVHPQNITKDTATISQPEYHHIIDVLRYKQGDNIFLFDGTGIEYSGRIELIDYEAKAIRISLVKRTKKKQSQRPLILVQGLIKSGNMDFIIQKATELGVTHIYPLITKNSIIKLDDKQEVLKIEKWLRIAEEACKQCGRNEIPYINKIWHLEELLDELDKADCKIVCSLYEKIEPLRDIKSSGKDTVAVMIGPEGDFRKEELRLIYGRGWIPVSLGKTVLRSETAAVAVLGAVSYKFGYWE